MSPRKILYFIDTLEIGGAEKSLLELTSRLDRTRFEPVVCHVYPGDSLRSFFEKAGVRVCCLGLRPKYRLVAGVRRARQLICTERPRLVHTSLFRANQIGRIAAFLSRTPVVSSLVNNSYAAVRLKENPHMSWWKLKSVQLTDAATARLVRRFHAVAEAVKETSCKQLRIPPDKIAVVPRGRDLSMFMGDLLTDRADSQNEIKFPRLLCVGRVIDQKGHKYAIEAFPSIREVFPEAELWIAGEGWLEADLRQKCRELGIEDAVKFLGRRDDVPDLLRQADVFVFPSLYEGLPGALVEAMLAGRAIVASDLPVTRELIDEGVHGRLVPPGNSQALAQAVLELLADNTSLKAMARKAQERARERFDINVVVGQMEQFYRECLAKS